MAKKSTNSSRVMKYFAQKQAAGYRKTTILLNPKSIEIIEKLKKETGKSYERIVNEAIEKAYGDGAAADDDTEEHLKKIQEFEKFKDDYEQNFIFLHHRNENLLKKFESFESAVKIISELKAEIENLSNRMNDIESRPIETPEPAPAKAVETKQETTAQKPVPEHKKQDVISELKESFLTSQNAPPSNFSLSDELKTELESLRTSDAKAYFEKLMGLVDELAKSSEYQDPRGVNWKAVIAFFQKENIQKIKGGMNWDNGFLSKKYKAYKKSQAD